MIVVWLGVLVLLGIRRERDTGFRHDLAREGGDVEGMVAQLTERATHG